MLSAEAIEMPVNGICQGRTNKIILYKVLRRWKTVDKTSKDPSVA